jgi:Mor family transcriptional regulator
VTETDKRSLLYSVPQQEQDDIIEQYINGASAYAISKRIGKRINYVIRLLNQRGISIRHEREAPIRNMLPVNDIIAAYHCGKSITQLAKDFMCSNSVIQDLFKDKQVIKRPNVIFDKLPHAEIINEYLSGTPELAISKKYECSRGTIARILRIHDVPRRGISEDNRFSIALRGRIQNRSQNLEYQGRETPRKYVGEGEIEIINRLRARGHEVIPQKSVGRYNIDITFGSVAVEVRFRSDEVKGVYFSARQFTRRIPTIFESGYKLVMLAICGSDAISNQLKNVIPLLEAIDSTPPEAGQCWMIRCRPDACTIREFQFDNRTLKLSSKKFSAPKP